MKSIQYNPLKQQRLRKSVLKKQVRHFFLMQQMSMLKFEIKSDTRHLLCTNSKTKNSNQSMMKAMLLKAIFVGSFVRAYGALMNFNI